VQHHLEAAGFATRLFVTPANLIPDAERTPPALFLLDIMVPGGDGLDVCRRLRANAALSTIPPKIPQGLKPLVDSIRFVPGINPRPTG